MDWPAFHGSFHDTGGCKLSPEGALSHALKGELTAEEAVSLSLPGEKLDELLSVAIRLGLIGEELLLVRLLSSFDRRGEDPQLLQWTTVKGTEFFLFMIKASGKSRGGRRRNLVSLLSEEDTHAPCGLRASELMEFIWSRRGMVDIQVPSYQIDMSYLKLWRPNGVLVFKEGSDVPLTEVALIRRLPSGDGISITSHVDGLGVQLGDILFILTCCAGTVAVTFTEQYFNVPTEFTEEPLYGRVGLNFIDITVPVENLIKKLSDMYEQDNEQQSKGDHEKSVDCPEEHEKEKEELVRQRKEQEKEKRESLQRRRAESRKNRCMRKEVKKMIGNANLGEKTNKEQVHDREYEEDIRTLFLSTHCEN